MTEKPNAKDVNQPWVVKDCGCSDKTRCNICDGHGWFYENTTNSDKVSECMRDAFERHF